MTRKPIIFVVIITVAAAALIYILNEYNRKNPDVADLKPAIIIDAASLIHAFEEDSVKAGKQYIDQVISVRGQVKSVDTSGVISLGIPGEMSSVQCQMDKRHNIDYSAFKEGTNIAVKGKCSGYESQELLGTDVKMNFCVVQK